VVFAPHPDDEVFGCGGSILKWISENHDVHIIYVTDNRALIKWLNQNANDLIEEEAKKYMNLSENEIAEIGLKEAEDAAKEFGFSESNVHLLKIYDQDAINKIDLGISLSKEILKDAERVIIPGDINSHPDHQAAHLIGKKAAKELNLKKAEFYVYYMNPMNAPKDKRTAIKTLEYREKLFEIMSIYKTQLCLKGMRDAWETLKRRRSERFGVFKFEDMNKYYNF